MRCLSAVALLLLSVPVVRSQTPSTAGNAISFVALPANPFRAVFSSDEKAIFVSLNTGIGVLKKADDGSWSFVRTVPLKGDPAGIVLDHDGHLLIVAASDGVAWLDTSKLINGDPDPVSGSDYYDRGAGAVDVNITPDDRFLFVSDEAKRRITVIDFDKARRPETLPVAIVGTIPVGIAPISLVFSPDHSTLYNTSEVAAADFGWPADRAPEGRRNPKRLVPQGAVIAIDVGRAESDPTHAVLSRLPAGPSPVRLVLSDDGTDAYVSVRGGNAVYFFDAVRIRSGAASALFAEVPVGSSPVGLAVVDQGRELLVANSDRFASKQTDQTLGVIDLATRTLLGTVPAGSFPREIRVSADGRTALVTNFNSRTLEFVDCSRLREIVQPSGSH